MNLYHGDIIQVDGTYNANTIGRCIVLYECGKTYAVRRAEQFTKYRIFSFMLNCELEMTPEFNKVTILARANDANVSCG